MMLPPDAATFIDAAISLSYFADATLLPLSPAAFSMLPDVFFAYFDSFRLIYADAISPLSAIAIEAFRQLCFMIFFR